MLNILFVGGYAGGVKALRAIAETKHRVVAALTLKDDASAAAGVLHLAEQLRCPTLSSANVRKARFALEIQRCEVDILINASSPYRICDEVISAPRVGAFNVHPSPLPKYAGLNPTSWAIYRGETAHGVTVHWMDSEFDRGPVAYQDMFPITESDTPLSLLETSFARGATLIQTLLSQAASDPGGIPRIAQDLDQREYFGRQAPGNGRLRWDRPAHEVLRSARAYDYGPLPSPWNCPIAFLNGRAVAVLAVEPTGEPCHVPPGTAEQRNLGTRVATADEWVVVRYSDPE